MRIFRGVRLRLQKGFLLLLVHFIFIPQVSKAQFYETGQDPFSVSWRQIKTGNYRLIFPEGFEQSAQRFAATLDTFFPVSHKYLLRKPKPVNIVFHTQSSLSNGMVVYAPKRMELYTIPPQNNEALDWLDQLALHETRHVVQLDALNRGLTKIGSFILGQQAVGAVTGLVPRWFLEGDAVYAETYFSQTGRGRKASFLMPYRTMVLSQDKLFPYEKAMLGSYKHFVPDIYQMGYPMVKMMRDSFDQDIFGKALSFTGRNPYLVFPFGHSLKKTSGLNNRRTYEYTFSSLKNNWIKHDTGNSYHHWPVTAKKTFTSYNLPVAMNDSMILVQKWSLSETRNFTLIDKNGKEKKLLTLGSNNAERISVHGSRVAWSENKTDIRWTNRTYSDITIFDVDSRKIKRLTRKSWYFSPAFSPDGKQLAVVEENPQYISSLVILDASDGRVISKTDAPSQSHLQFPQWMSSGEVVCMLVDKAGKSIVKLNGSGMWETMLPPTFKDISSYCLAEGNKIVISGENDGVNNLFLFDVATGKYMQVTNSRFGAFEPFIDQKTLYFSEYTASGYRIATVPYHQESFTEAAGYTGNIIQAVSPGNSDPNIQTIRKDSTIYPVKKYSRLPHAINIHSWLPAFFNYSVSNVTNPQVYPGILLMSQDVLGTMVSSAGYSYREGFSHLHASVNYKAMFPVIGWSIDVGGPIDRIGGNATIPHRFNRNLQSIVNISLPMNFSRGKYAHGFTPYVEWEYNRDAYYVKSENKYFQEINSINWGANYYRYTRMAIRDIYPRFGFSSFFKVKSTPFENNVFNSIAAVSFRQYLPGLFRNHSFQLRYAYQYQDPLRYLYSTMINFPAGYHSQRTEQLHVFNTNYALPLWYPDFHAGPVFYLKRIRTNFFYEMAWNSFHSKPDIITKDILRSVGTDIIADIHFIRVMFPFQVGARFTYHPEENSFFTQAIFSVNLVY